MLRDWHENLKFEQALIENSISNEELKCKIAVVEYKTKMEVEAVNFALKLERERQKNKFRSMQKKYRFALACSWGLVILLFYESSNKLVSRLMLT
jgi:hypothetical protein